MSNTLKEDIVTALILLDGIATLNILCLVVGDLRDFSNNKEPQASIRNVLQIHSSDSDTSIERGGDDDIFFRVKPGVWGLRDHFHPR